MTRVCRFGWVALAMGLIAACDASSNPGLRETGAVASVGGAPAPKAAAASAAKANQDATRDVAHADEFHEFSLTIYGYNYTDTEIGNFEVNGRGGGNVEVSTRSTGGSKSTCCAALFTPINAERPIRIKWTRDGDVWCEQDVRFEGPVPMNAKYLEVHFLRDGKIEIAATSTNSPPRFSLDRIHGNRRYADPNSNVNNDSKFSRCRNGYR